MAEWPASSEPLWGEGGHSHKAEGGRKLPHDWPPILKYSYPSVSSCYSSFRSPLGPSLYRKVCLSLSHSVPKIIWPLKLAYIVTRIYHFTAFNHFFLIFDLVDSFLFLSLVLFDPSFWQIIDPIKPTFSLHAGALWNIYWSIPHPYVHWLNKVGWTWLVSNIDIETLTHREGWDRGVIGCWWGWGLSYPSPKHYSPTHHVWSTHAPYYPYSNIAQCSIWKIP